MIKRFYLFLVVLIIIGTWCNGQYSLDSSKQVKKERALSFFNKGLSQEKLGNFKKADTFFHKALSLYPDMPGAYVELGKIEMARKNTQSALNYYLKAREAYHKLHAKKISALDKQKVYEIHGLLKGIRMGLFTPLYICPPIMIFCLTEWLI